jgi:hypothetical protein
MQATHLDLPEPQAGPFIEPLTEPFTGRYEERPHEPTEPYTADAISAANDRVEVQDAMEDVIRDDGVMRLRTEEVGVTVGRPSLRTSLAKGDIRAALDRDDNQREGGREIMEVYLNVIRSVETDGNNEAYSQLLEQEEEI